MHTQSALVPALLVAVWPGCGSGSGLQGDATSEPDIEVGEPVALNGVMFATRNTTDATVYAVMHPWVQDELPMERNLGAGWEPMTLWLPAEEIECPGSPDECVCPTPPVPWQVRQILPGDEYSIGWAPGTPPSSRCYVYDTGFCSDCRCYRRADILPGTYAVTRCVNTDYECTESEPCGPESVGYFRPAVGAGEEICIRVEFEVPGVPSIVEILVE